MSGVAQWPELAWSDWADTADTLHMWTQIVGKTRLALTPLQNHWWNVPLYVTARGLGTSAMDYEDDVLDIEFDFVAHELHLRMSSGANQTMKLRPRSVADFYAEYLGCLKELGVAVKIDPMPCELAKPIRFDLDTEHASYDPDYAHRFWQVLAHAEKVFRAWGTAFLGKVSPVHFFWGSFDLAVTRFSGRPAPPRPGADSIQREAYSHEVISAGFWPGNGGYGTAAFYCYAAPVPDGLADAKIRPDGAGWDKALGEFVFKYNVVRALASPEKAVMDFLESSYSAAADVARWDRAALERR
ncbi:DUF5996 family protein [Tunturiibacter empetritectus]|uniref:Ava_C0101 and related proteins n=2 Tax=Tunturiibacter TaxID=3154218 RepID=A0A852VH81_9BACT|nr:DUF5996 family protein [Edaphobacter lichenicola]NYF92178.1 hypothetical protein [Edaphobacter lichenicola]